MKTLVVTADQAARDRFIYETDQAFSVIAPAGVGKTYSIVERVARMITAGTEPIALVTYTKKAAEEMRQRLEQRLKTDGKPLPYEKVFIGTIHALCLELMRNHAQLWDLPAQAEVLGDAEALCARWLQETPNPLKHLSSEAQERFLQHFPQFLGAKSSQLLLQVTPRDASGELSPPPIFNFVPLFQAEFKGPQKKTHERLKNWAQEYIALNEHPPFAMPELPDPPKDESPLLPLYNDIFGEFINWRSQEGLRYAQIFANEFSHWRRASGLYLYDDLIDLVLQKLTSGGEIGYSIVLDEAQDTSPRQLEVLKKLAIAKNGQLQLTMVGDPQQSIYSSRASLPHYLHTHDELIARHGLEPLTFSVTFRCPEAVVGWANKIGPHLLRGGKTQAAFVPLQARPDAPAGSVSRMVLTPHEPEMHSTEERDWANARALAQAMAKKLQQGQFLPQDVHHIAILAARRDALFKLSEALTEVGFRVQLHAEGDTATPAQRLAQSIVHLLKYPFDSFEIVGLLRELSPLTDRLLAKLAQENPEAINILQPPSEELKHLSPEAFELFEKLHLAWQTTAVLPLDKAIVTFIKLAGFEDAVRALDKVYNGTLWPAWRAELLRIVALATGNATAGELLRAMGDAAGEKPIEPGALQLMTLHKAKGLEWPVVILPFLYRPMTPPPASYPMLDPTRKTPALTWKISPQLMAPASKENFQRLLYVGLTRAKRQLILVDDAAFYETYEKSLADDMSITAAAAHHQHFLQLPEAHAIDLPRGEAVEAAPAPTYDFLQNFSRPLALITPSSLAQEQEPEYEARELSAEEISGLEYGEWWHNLWDKAMALPRAEMPTEILKLIAKSRFEPRALRELEQLKTTALWPMLIDENLKIMTEMSFFVQLDEGVMEGRVDMILQQKGRALIVDWKTDHLLPEKLLATYGPQMLAYKKAFERLLQCPVDVQLYSTLHGVLIDQQSAPSSK